MMEEKKRKIKLKEMISITLKALKISIKTKSRFSIIINVLGFFIALVPALISNTLRVFTDEIQLLSTSNTKDISEVLITFTLLASLVIVKVIFYFIHSYTLGIDSIKTNKYIRETILKCSCDVKYKYVQNYDNFKERIAFADTLAGFRVAGSMQTIIVWLQNIVTFISVFYVLLNINPWIVLVLLITSIPSVILSYKQKDEVYLHNTKWMKEGAMVVHYFFMLAGEYAMAEVRHLGILDYLKYRWKQIAQSYIRKKNSMTKKHVLYNSMADILRNVVYIGVLLIVTHEIYKNPAIGLGAFMLVFTLSGQLQESTSKLLIDATQFISDIHYMKDFFDLDKLERDSMDTEAKPINKANIEFRNVDFTYPNSENKVLKNVNIKINDGEKIAIVGENGSGKSTFVNLICGMYEPDSGTVKINDTNVQENLSAVRKSISAVFQDFGRYETTIKENITVSNKQRIVEDVELIDLLKRTNAYEVVSKQPDKLNEEIGMFSQNGNNISGGQWQKIAITRAVYRNEARILILDEPTAALDPIAEAQLYTDFANLTENKTTILISHRLGITSVVDRILVFKDGQIIEDGSHQELINNKGYYAKMYNAQAQWYDDTVIIIK